MKGFRIVCDRLFFDDPEKAKKAKAQFLIYKNRPQGVFMEACVSLRRREGHAGAPLVGDVWRRGPRATVRRDTGSEQALVGVLVRAAVVSLRPRVV